MLWVHSYQYLQYTQGYYDKQQVYGEYNELESLECSLALDSKQHYKGSVSVQAADWKQQVKPESNKVSPQCKGGSFTPGPWG